MKQIDVNKLTEELAEKYGVNLKGSSFSDRIEFRPTDIEYGVGFIIKVTLEWRNLSAEFIPDNFSAGLLKIMGTSETYKKNIFKLLAQRCLHELSMEVNGEEVNPVDINKWSGSWTQLYLRLSKAPIIVDELDITEFKNVILDISDAILGLVLTLLPLEEVSIDESTVGLPEGAVTRIEMNRYERSQFNRQACIKIHGCICKVCDFDFIQMYGSLGKGFIHVHHITPVSELSPDYKINLEKDLVPVCPNCHAMLHKRTPPYLIEELKSIISSNMKVGKG
ncbi:HNH endonuclease [Metabacillus niabensis]|uniref:HNH endonuclease n=1 Tax=Metabacillus niabensis TaxID=324854 RepID=UPI001CFA8161|nr:HNH endonuclease [Metabacillus niabensis]